MCVSHGSPKTKEISTPYKSSANVKRNVLHFSPCIIKNKCIILYSALLLHLNLKLRSCETNADEMALYGV